MSMKVLIVKVRENQQLKMSYYLFKEMKVEPEAGAIEEEDDENREINSLVREMEAMNVTDKK